MARFDFGSGSAPADAELERLDLHWKATADSAGGEGAHQTPRGVNGEHPGFARVGTRYLDPRVICQVPDN